MAGSVPWFKRRSTQQRRNLQGRRFRREAEAAIFRADADPNISGPLAPALEGAGKRQGRRANPLAPGDGSPDPDSAARTLIAGFGRPRPEPAEPAGPTQPRTPLEETMTDVFDIPPTPLVSSLPLGRRLEEDPSFIQELRAPSSRGLELLPGLEALEEFEPQRRDLGQPRFAERDLDLTAGIRPDVGAFAEGVRGAPTALLSRVKGAGGRLLQFGDVVEAAGQIATTPDVRDPATQRAGETVRELGGAPGELAISLNPFLSANFLDEEGRADPERIKAFSFTMLSGSEALETLTRTATGGELGIRDVGIVPEEMNPLFAGLLESMAPINFIAAGATGGVTAALRTAAADTRLAGRAMAPVRLGLQAAAGAAEPFENASFAGRFSREVAVDMAAQEAYRQTEGQSTPVRLLAALGAGVVAGGLTDPRVSARVAGGELKTATADLFDIDPTADLRAVGGEPMVDTAGDAARQVTARERAATELEEGLAPVEFPAERPRGPVGVARAPGERQLEDILLAEPARVPAGTPPDAITRGGEVKRGETSPINQRAAADEQSPPDTATFTARTDPDPAGVEKTVTDSIIDIFETSGKPRRAARFTTPRQDPEGADAFVEAMRVPGERGAKTLLRRNEGALGRMAKELEFATEEGGRMLRDRDVTTFTRGHHVVRPEQVPTMDALHSALNQPTKVASGEIQVPQGFEDIYQLLRNLTDWEEAHRIDFDPNMATIDDYWFRGWRAPEGWDSVQNVRGRLGATPAFRKQRQMPTYEEMRAQGFEPISWNPFEQWAVSRRMGVQHREQMQLVERMKEMELAVPVSRRDEVMRDGKTEWVVPKGVGPAFEGKVHPAGTTGGEVHTGAHAVPRELANMIQGIYGQVPDTGKVVVSGRSISPKDLLGKAVFGSKRALLKFSFFQQLDFARRNFGGNVQGVIDGLRRAAADPNVTVRQGLKEAGISALEIPQAPMRIARAYFSPQAGRALNKWQLSEEPLIAGRPGITGRGITEGGLSVSDTTIDPRTMRANFERLAEREGVPEDLLRQGRRRMSDFFESMDRGLFNRVYPAAILPDIEHNIAPMMARKMIDENPGVTDEAINGAIARVANMKYSTLPSSQRLIQSPFMRALSEHVMFSTNETESLLRQALSAAPGVGSKAERAYWRENWVGTLLGLGMIAELIHYSSTALSNSIEARSPQAGEFLPLERFKPFTGKWGLVPTGFNREFLQADIPFEGRGGTQLSIDLLGQLDTVFRLVDPKSFIQSRESAPIREAFAQREGRDFYGRPIDDVGPGGIISRTRHAVGSLAAPIGLGQLSAAAAAAFDIPDVLGRGEPRVGVAGGLIQALGENVAAETSRQVRDRIARESGIEVPADGGMRPARAFAELTDEQQALAEERAPRLAEELDIRDIEGAEQGQVHAQGRLEREENNQEARKAEAFQWNKLVTRGGDPDAFGDVYSEIQIRRATANAEVNEQMGLFTEERDPEKIEDPGQRAVAEWFQGFEQFQEPGGFDWDGFDEWESGFRETLTPRQTEFIDEIVGFDHAEEIRPWLSARSAVGESGYWTVADTLIPELRTEFEDLTIPDTKHDLQEAILDARQTGDDQAVVNLNVALKELTKREREARLDMRRADAQLDRNLQFAYGHSPVEAPARKGGGVQFLEPSGGGGFGGGGFGSGGFGGGGFTR